MRVDEVTLPTEVTFPISDGVAVEEVPPVTVGERARRAMNVAVALLGLLLAAPVLVVIAILVRLSSPGPVLYRQLRVGLDRRTPYATDADLARRQEDLGGRVFMMYKFRTMYDGADRAGEIWARHRDPRVTPVGGVLRKYRLDELPQLYNVLKGEMNIVGPRPEQPKIFAELRGQVDRYTLRQRVLPGITGLAQVNRPYDQSVDDVKEKVELDLDYLGRKSPGEDLRIMIQTIPVMLNRKGAL